jgi:muramoyltetrapeptide carboxypeptidase
MIKPKKLQKGDTIGIIGPSNFATEDLIEKGVTVLREMGYKIKIGKSCNHAWYNFAGNDQLRADDINEMFSNNAINAIICMRGGYGCNRLIDLINFDNIKQNPKLFIGYSDITTLHCAIEKYSNMVTIHGPMLTSNIANNFDDFTKKSFLKIIEGKGNFLDNPPSEKIKTLIAGTSTGKLIGGNLELITRTLGTNYSLNTNGKILFLEDINEYTYKIDRMLYHLKHCNIFKNCTGVIIGSLKKCVKEKSCDFETSELLKLFFKDYKKPVIYNFIAGHCFPTVTVPLGINCMITANKNNATIKLLEQAVI